MRRWAIYTLSVMGKKSANAVGALIPLLDEGDSLNRALTTVAIRSMGKSAIPALKQALQVGSLEVKYRVIRILKTWADEDQDIQASLASLQDHEDEEIQRLVSSE